MGKLRNRTRPSKLSNDLKIKHGYESGEQTTKVKQVTRADDASLTKSQFNIFPSFTPVLVTTLTLIFRTWHVLQPRNWWMVHPDEVYQSVEVAHLHLYGYGFRSHEYSPPDPPLPLTKYKEVELKAGMYGLSSPLYPHFYVTVGWLVSLTGYSFSPYVLWRVSHVVVSSTLPLVLYHYVCTLHKSHTAGCMAAIMAATSVHLNVLGTHCLVHSFLAPFTFFSLLLLIGNSQRSQCDGTGNSDDRGSSLVEISRRSDDEELSRCKKIAPDINGNPIKTDPNNAFQFKQKSFVKVKIFIKNDLVKFCGIVSVLAIFSLNQWIVFPTNGGRNSSRWVYQKTEDVQDINTCLHYVASQTDVTGVFCDCNLHMTGGFTLLHQDVTFMALLKGGYYEYGPKSRSKEISWAGRNQSVVEFTGASNYVAEQNALATARVIIERRNYNYVIVRTDRPFLPVGFREVFSSGNRRVLQRSFDAKSEQNLQDFLD
uniref:Mannosyltransferase n=1 Tax=Biomphalaria glabrata TaxID=6526 RepID=A0A2C9KV92_BIOGL